MNIFGYSGSMRGENSLGYQTISQLITEMGYADQTINLYTADKVSAEICRGCCNCFEQGVCPLDKKDTMQELKRKILEADLLVFTSPVYLHQISGSMKNFIDRLSYWAHLYKLIGKRVILCTATCTNGSEFAMGYLRKVFSSMGCYLIGEISADIYTKKEDLRCEAEKMKRKLLQSYENPDFSYTPQQEEIYQTMKKRYRSIDTWEARYWEQAGLFDYENFEVLLRAKMSDRTDPEVRTLHSTIFD